jgi:hypothetical protein
MAAAVFTVNASTRRDGRLTATSPTPSMCSVIEVTTSSMPEKSAVDSEVRATSS